MDTARRAAKLHADRNPLYPTPPAPARSPGGPLGADRPVPAGPPERCCLAQQMLSVTGAPCGTVLAQDEQRMACCEVTCGAKSGSTINGGQGSGIMTRAGRQAAELRVQREVKNAAPGEQHFASVVDTAVYTRCAPPQPASPTP